MFADQEKMAGEICKAFETAGKVPPKDLRDMFDKFKDDMEAAGKKVVLGGRGSVKAQEFTRA